MMPSAFEETSGATPTAMAAAIRSVQSRLV
jgi:hypothetical protein